MLLIVALNICLLAATLFNIVAYLIKQKRYRTYYLSLFYMFALFTVLIRLSMYVVQIVDWIRGQLAFTLPQQLLALLVNFGMVLVGLAQVSGMQELCINL